MIKSSREIVTHQLDDCLDYSKVIEAVNIGVKYRPPKIGIEFYLKNDKKFDQQLTHNRSSSNLINDIDNYD